MSRKLLTIVSLMLAFSWPLTAGKVTKEVKIPGSGAHVLVEQKGSSGSLFSIPENQESDAILSAGEQRRAYITGGQLDTLAYCPSSEGGFSFLPGEYELVMYELPTSGIVKGVNPAVRAWGGSSDDAHEVTIWKVTYPENSQGEWYSTDDVDGAGWAGYWWDEADNKVPLFVTDEGVVSYYGDTADEVGPYAETIPIANAQDLIKERVWPASDFVHATFNPTTCPDGKDCWIATADYGAEPEFEKGDWVGILVQNQAPEGTAYATFHLCQGEGLVNQWVFAKFYNEGGGTSGEGGWHIRSWILDWPMAIEWTGDPPPFIKDMVRLGTTVSTEPREVTATITDIDPIAGNAGVAEALVWYAVNEGAAASVEMTADVDTFAADIPGASPGDVVEYWITATDLADNTSESPHITYEIFKPVESSLLINNGTWPDAYIEFYWLYGLLGEWPHDIWNVSEIGATPAELYPNYETIVQLDNDPTYVCGDDLDAWLDKGNKNFVVSGDEWMNYCFDDWEATDYGPGDFPYDYMGVDQTYPDMNYSVKGDQEGVSRLIPVENDDVSGELFAFLSDSLLLNYDPDYEIGAENWLDGADAADDATVAFWGLSGILDSLLETDPEADTVASGIYKELDNGSKTAYLAFDVLSLNTVAVGLDTLHGAGYHWIGVYPEGALPQVLEWMDIYVSIDDEVAQLPSKFTLHQNYPNPFNPVTTINFDLPSDGNVTLTIYNMLGQKVATLVNDFRSAGRHHIAWNGTTDLGTAVATGVYLYNIDAGDFSATKKMVLLK